MKTLRIIIAITLLGLCSAVAQKALPRPYAAGHKQGEIAGALRSRNHLPRPMAREFEPEVQRQADAAKVPRAQREQWMKGYWLGYREGYMRAELGDPKKQ